MPSRFLAVAVAGLSLALPSVVPAAAEICHDYKGGQYAETRTCVTSVLPPQAGNAYGPDRMSAESDDSGAWCEGAPGPGVGEIVTLHQRPAQVVGSVIIVNGYAKTPQTFSANGRVKRVRIQTSGGYERTSTLTDTRDAAEIKFPASKLSWIRLTILETYPGDRHDDTCISKLYLNHEEFGAVEEPRDQSTEPRR